MTQMQQITTSHKELKFSAGVLQYSMFFVFYWQK